MLTKTTTVTHGLSWGNDILHSSRRHRCLKFMDKWQLLATNSVLLSRDPDWSVIAEIMITAPWTLSLLFFSLLRPSSKADIAISSSVCLSVRQHISGPLNWSSQNLLHRSPVAVTGCCCYQYYCYCYYCYDNDDDYCLKYHQRNISTRRKDHKQHGTNLLHVVVLNNKLQVRLSKLVAQYTLPPIHINICNEVVSTVHGKPTYVSWPGPVSQPAIA